MPELEDGLVYRVHHYRRFLPPKEKMSALSEDDLDPKGGRTLVELGRMVERSDGTKFFEARVSAEARCSPKDTYNRKRGRDIALGRALKAYGG